MNNMLRPAGALSVRLATRGQELIVALAAAAITAGCSNSPASPSANTMTIRLVFQGATTRRADLPASAQACVTGVGVTHAHPSWRSFAAIPLVAAPPNRYEFAFNDVPVDTRVSFRVNDQNFCDENPTGAVTRNVFVNDVRLIQNTLTPGSGDEPGFAISVSARGTVSQ